MKFVLGALCANAAEPDQLLHMLRTADRLFEAGTFTWSAAGVGYLMHQSLGDLVD